MKDLHMSSDNSLQTVSDSAEASAEGNDSGTKGTGSAGLQPDGQPLGDGSGSAEDSGDSGDPGIEPNHNQTLLRDR